jgi:hypothetical protein
MTRPLTTLPLSLTLSVSRLRGACLTALSLGALAIVTGCAAPPPAAPPEQVAQPAPAPAPVAPPPAPAPPAPPPPPAAPPPILPFDEALLSAANNLLSKSQLPPNTRYDVVIDPLIDGLTGAQTTTTQAMGVKLTQLIKDSYPRYAVQPFNVSTVQQGPLILIGTFTGVNAERKTEGLREAYRICLALADLKTGKLVSKGLAFARAEGIDSRPLPYFRDSPVWLDDAATTGYIRTCQGPKAGDPINPNYLDRIVTAATIAEAIDSYDEGKYADALKLYETALGSPGGNQLRVHTGMYLTNLKLRRMEPARKAFGEIVEQGLDAKRLGVKFLFRPGTAALWVDPKAGPLPYAMWLKELASRSAERTTCLELAGHTSPTGAEPLNERLSLLRADSVRKSIAALAPAMSKRMESKGYGSQKTLVGTGKDDLSDALDRRVELVVQDCPT